jgi:hypothetical protein
VNATDDKKTMKRRGRDEREGERLGRFQDPDSWKKWPVFYGGSNGYIFAVDIPLQAQLSDRIIEVSAFSVTGHRLAALPISQAL